MGYCGLGKILVQLEVYISTEESGKDWELITIAAIFFHSIEALVNQKIGNKNNLFYGPFDIAMGREVTDVEIKLFPDKDFNSFKDNFLMTLPIVKRSKGNLHICIPSFQQFPVDIIIVYWIEPKEFCAIGIQN